MTAEAPAPGAGASLGERASRVREQLATGFRTYRVLWYVTLAGFVWRAITILVIRPSCELDKIEAGVDITTATQSPIAGCKRVVGDGLSHYTQAKLMAQGHWYPSSIFYLRFGVIEPGGTKPPMYSTFLFLFDKVGIESPDVQRVGTAFVGALAIFLLGLLAWRLVGPRAGIAAAAIAAVYPHFWINDGELKNDSMIVVFVALVLLAAYALIDDPRPKRAVWLGLALGFAALTRGESSLMLVFVALPAIALLRRLSFQARAKLFVLTAVVTVAVITPWVTYNMARFHQFTTMSVGTGSVILNGSCDDAYYGDNFGYLSFECFKGDAEKQVNDRLAPKNIKISVPCADDRKKQCITPELQAYVLANVDESDVDAVYRDVGVKYVKAHTGRLPAVMAARVGRMFDVYRAGTNTDNNAYLEDRGAWQSWSALWIYYAVIPFAVTGAFVLRRDKIAIAPLVGVILSIAFVAATTFGITRFRGPADGAMIVFAGVGIDWALTWWRQRRAAAGGDRNPGEAGGTLPPVGDSLMSPLHARATAVRTRPRRTRPVAVGLFLLLLLGFGAAACGSPESAQAPSPTTDQTTTTTIDDPGTTEPGTTEPEGTLPPVSIVPPTTVAKPVTTKKQVTTTTRKPVTTTAKPTPTTPLDQLKFCQYVQGIDLNAVGADPVWADGFNHMRDTIIVAVQVAPKAVKQALLDLQAMMDALKPAVDAGQMTSNEDVLRWLAAQTPETQTRLKSAFKQVQLYTMANCK